MDFSEKAMDDSSEKIQLVALYFGLFPRLQWKVFFSRASDGILTLSKLIL